MWCLASRCTETLMPLFSFTRKNSVRETRRKFMRSESMSGISSMSMHVRMWMYEFV